MLATGMIISSHHRGAVARGGVSLYGHLASDILGSIQADAHADPTSRSIIFFTLVWHPPPKPCQANQDGLARINVSAASHMNYFRRHPALAHNA